MSDTNNPMVKTLPELPETTNLSSNNFVWIHQSGDTTDRRITLATLFANAYPMTPADSEVTIGSVDTPFAETHSIEVHVGSAVLSESSNILHMPDATVNGDLTVTGSLTILGEATRVNVETVTVNDNIIELNSNQTGVPSSELRSGIEVNRGDEVNYQFLFVEEDSTFRIGEIGDTQPVATREDSPAHNGVAIWNDNTKRFEAKTSFTGTIEAANRLADARRISLGGSLSGSVDFDGSEDVTIIASVANGDNHHHDTQYYPKAESDARYLELTKAETISNDLTITGTLHTIDIQGTSFSGNAGTASKLRNDRQIALIGDVTGAQVFDGSQNIEIDIHIKNVTSDDLDAGRGHSHDDQYYTKELANSRFVNVEGDTIVGALDIDGTVTATEFVGAVTGNADTSSRWKNLMTLTLDGDLTGSVEFDGSANRILTAEIVNDSHSHDTQYYPRDEADATFVSISQLGDEADVVQGNFTVSGEISAQSGFVGDLAGNASTATQWEQLQEVHITGGATGTLELLGGESPINLDLVITDNSHNHVSENISDATAQATPNVLVRRDGDSSFAANTITANTVIANLQGNVLGDVEGQLTGNVIGDVTGDVIGNADTASTLKTSRTITLSDGVSGEGVFDGSSDIDIPISVNRDRHNHDNIYFRQSDLFTRTASDERYPQFADVYLRDDAEDTFVKQSGGDIIDGDLTITGKMHGTAEAADALSTGRYISLKGNATGQAVFDGSENASISVVVTGATGIVDGSSYNFTIADKATVNGSLAVLDDLTVSGDLIVNGTTTTLNTQDLEIQDNVIKLNVGYTGGWSGANASGFEIVRGSAMPYEIKVKGDAVYAGFGTNVAPLTFREEDLTDGSLVVWDNATKRITSAAADTEIDATVANATHASVSDAFTTPQTITISGGGISGEVTIGDGAANTSIDLTVGTIANASHANTADSATTASRLSTARGISLTGAITASPVEFNGAAPIAINTTLSPDLASRLDTIENDIEANEEDLTTLTNRVTECETNITDHATKLQALEAIDSDTRLTTLEDLESGDRLSHIETRLDTIYVEGTPDEGLLADARADITNLQNNKVDNTDPRLTDSRDPNPHNHVIEDITLLQETLDQKADTNHNHDSNYASINHDHDDTYAPIVHNHDERYATADHDHEGQYEPYLESKGTAFNKDFGTGNTDVARGDHNHDSTYAAIEHTHTEYAPEASTTTELNKRLKIVQLANMMYPPGYVYTLPFHTPSQAEADALLNAGVTASNPVDMGFGTVPDHWVHVDNSSTDGPELWIRTATPFTATDLDTSKWNGGASMFPDILD